MATAKKKKTTKVRDLKPSKDAKGGSNRNLAGSTKSRQSYANKHLY